MIAILCETTLYSPENRCANRDGAGSFCDYYNSRRSALPEGMTLESARPL